MDDATTASERTPLSARVDVEGGGRFQDDARLTKSPTTWRRRDGARTMAWTVCVACVATVAVFACVGSIGGPRTTGARARDALGGAEDDSDDSKMTLGKDSPDASLGWRRPGTWTPMRGNGWIAPKPKVSAPGGPMTTFTLHTQCNTRRVRVEYSDFWLDGEKGERALRRAS